MHTPTIYSSEYEGSENFKISQEKLHHLINVLRLNKGKSLMISNGRGVIAHGILDEGGSIVINNIEEVKRERTIDFFLASIDSVNRMRFAIEKLTELGVYSITIGNTVRSGSKSFNIDKMKLWAESAVEQSGNPFIPKIHKVKSIDYDRFSSCLDVQGDRVFDKMLIDNIAIGPEGGWDSHELSQFKTVYSLDFPTLRTETAAIVAATLLLSA